MNKQEWYQKFAQAVQNNSCIPCAECEHRHTCFFCKLTERDKKGCKK